MGITSHTLFPTCQHFIYSAFRQAVFLCPFADGYPLPGKLISCLLSSHWSGTHTGSIWCHFVEHGATIVLK